MSEMVRTGIVRILRESDQQVVGVGFLVDAAKRTILTCAHVVNAAIGNVSNQDKPRSLISVDFPFLANGQRYDSRVLHFHPKSTNGIGDLAVLEIIKPLPEKAKAVRLAVAETYNGHEFGVYGFPQGFEESGQYVEGRLQEQLANKRIQAIGTTNLGYFVEYGFSGSPVLDKQLDAVVGIMMQVDTETDKRVSFLSPIDILAELFPEISYARTRFGDEAHLFKPSLSELASQFELHINTSEFNSIDTSRYAIIADENYEPTATLFALSINFCNRSDTDVTILSWTLDAPEYQIMIDQLTRLATVRIYPSGITNFRRSTGDGKLGRLHIGSHDAAENVLLRFVHPLPLTLDHSCIKITLTARISGEIRVQARECLNSYGAGKMTSK